MSARRTNLGLLVGLAVAFATGFLAFSAGTSWNRPVVIAHGIAGVVIVALSPWKSAVARRGLARRRSGRVPSLALALLVVTALVFGFAHSTGVSLSIGPFSSMQVHVGAALVAVPFLLWHIVVRPARPHRTDLGRRQLLRTATFASGGGLALLLIEALGRAVSLPGTKRRFTGSYETGTGQPEVMPVTQWFNDTVPSIDKADWTLRLGQRDVSYAELDGAGAAVDALIDCTGGWYATQRWEGAWLSDLLGDPGDARSVVVRSQTGYTRRFPIEDASRLMVATRAAGEPLSPGHGYPARLVAPGRRGFWWVKWVVEIELSTRPWWMQLPFPAT